VNQQNRTTDLRLLWVRRLAILCIDGLLAAGSLWVAMILRFDGDIPGRFLDPLPDLTLLLVAVRMGVAWLFRLHRWSFRFSGLSDAFRVVVGGLLGSGLFVTGIFLLELQSPPRSTVLMEFFMTTTAMGFLRFSPRLAHMLRADRLRLQRSKGVRTLILGAGGTGEALLRDLRRSHEHDYLVIGFVDDDPKKQGTIIGGRPVMGTVSELPRLVERHQIVRVLIAVPRLAASDIREILSLCAHQKVQFKILPLSYLYLQERSSSVILQDLSPEDLLARAPVDFSQETECHHITSHTVLVTGAAGSIGSEICAQILRAGVRQLVMVDLNENGLYMLQRRFERTFDAAIYVEIANIRDRHRMESLVSHYRPQDIFHAAAHKHVPLMEAAPCEAVKNNVLGTRIIAEAADRFGCERFVLISTDKAVRPSNVMGATKRVAETLVRWVGDRSTTRFCAVRFGNVLDSAASVVPIFREQIAAGGPVTVTHPEVRRYFMTIREAVGLVLKAAYGDYGTLCILEMGEQIRIYDLARFLITMSGLVPEVDIPIRFTGLRPGEKIYEELLTEDEAASSHTEEKIHVAAGTAPPPELELELEQLIEAAFAEDVQRTVAMLRKLVPTYGHPAIPDEVPTASQEQPG